MIVSHRHGFVFVKTRKTAGSSMEIQLSRVCGPFDIITALTADDEGLRREADGRGPQNYGRTTPTPSADISRDHVYPDRPNPQGMVFQRMVVTHEPAHRIRRMVGTRMWDLYFTFAFERNPWDAAVSRFHWAHRHRAEGSFDAWVLKNYVNYVSNYALYSDPKSGNVIVDRVYRYEEIDAALIDIRTRLGTKRLPRTLDTRAKALIRPTESDYRAYYDDATRELIAQRDAPAIDLLGYTF